MEKKKSIYIFFFFPSASQGEIKFKDITFLKEEKKIMKKIDTVFSRDSAERENN